MRGLARTAPRRCSAAERADLLDYLAHKFHRQAKPRSAARLLSSLKRYYQYLLREGRISADPTLQVESPKLPRSLPKSLTEEDVDALLAAPNVDAALGLRDKAMLETLYASGLRVSELVTMNVAQVSQDMGVVRIIGKGSKERLVPLGEEALAWIRRYVEEARPRILDGKRTDALFVTARGEAMTPPGVLAPDPALCHAGGTGQADLAAYAAPCVRDAPAESRRRPARGADAAGPCGYLHDADLHACRARAPEAVARRNIIRGDDRPACRSSTY